MPAHIQEKVYKPPSDEIYYSETHVGDKQGVDVPVDLTEEDEEEIEPDS